jgi:single-stranded-DNA-specific exonuclease
MYIQRQFNHEVEQFLKKNEKKPLLARLLSQRKIPDIDNFLNPPSKAHLHLRNLAQIRNLKETCDLLIEVKKNNGSASVIGDYDVDGIMSSYMVKRICEILDVECNVFLPSRFEHGYGLNAQTLASFLAFTVENKTPELLLILDCGSSSEKEIRKLKSFGIKKIAIIDHHIFKEENFSKSADTVVNWRMNENSEEMCTCGLVYLLASLMFDEAHLSIDNVLELLFLAAIGTIADVTPIIGDNRIIVKQGLSFFNNCLTSKGLSTLIGLCKLNNKTITQEQVGFRLAPRLNAVGRLGSPQEAFDLLVSKDKDEIDDIIQVLEITNKNRQEIQGSILEEAIGMFNEKEMEYGILLVNPKWNIGVVGVVASEIAEKFHKPTVVIGREKGVLKGSGRSIKGISLIKILDLCSEMFDKYGGHDYAAGVALKKKYLDKSIKMFNDACQKVFVEENKNCNKEVFYDAVLKPSSISEDTYKIVNLLYPYCDINNPEPVFKLSEVAVSLVDRKENPNWVLSILKIDGINFKFKTFSEEIGCCKEFGKKANVYFKFPQSYDEKWGMQLDVVGIEVIEK